MSRSSAMMTAPMSQAQLLAYNQQQQQRFMMMAGPTPGGLPGSQLASDPNVDPEALGGKKFGPPGCNLFVFHIPSEWSHKDLYDVRIEAHIVLLYFQLIFVVPTDLFGVLGKSTFMSLSCFSISDFLEKLLVQELKQVRQRRTAILYVLKTTQRLHSSPSCVLSDRNIHMMLFCFQHWGVSFIFGVV